MFNIRNNYFNSFTPKFIKKKDLNKLVGTDNYQIVQIQNDRMWEEGHILFSVHIDPHNFLEEYSSKLDKNKNIVLCGEYHDMARFYRILKFNKYKVYLVK